MIDPLTAAADVMTGAMIALVPSPDDAKRLAVDGGEALDQLHLTLLYLGDADQIDEPTRDQLRDWAREAVAGWDSVEANAFAPALFNPTGDEPCAVLICSGPDLAEFYETTLADVSELIELPDDLHAPWVPHVTLAYLTPTTAKPQGVVDLVMSAGDNGPFGQALYATGPVNFDRLRLAFAGEVLDVPFGAKAQAPAIPAPDAAAGETQDEPASAELEPGPSVVASAVPTRDAFNGCLRCWGQAHTGACPPGL